MYYCFGDGAVKFEGQLLRCATWSSSMLAETDEHVMPVHQANRPPSAAIDQRFCPKPAERAATGRPQWVASRHSAMPERTARSRPSSPFPVLDIAPETGRSFSERRFGCSRPYSDLP